jgi:hypothetical protein
VELLVVLVLVALLLLFLLMAVPRGREQARLAGCQKNLAQIGLALGLYDQVHRALPTVEALVPADASGEASPPGPLRVLVDALGLQDLRGLTPDGPPPPATGPVPGEITVPGFFCASDPEATAGRFRAPISYRGLTGSDERGTDGPFAPGRRIGLAQVEAGDGASYTAGFSERLAGDGSDHPAARNFAVVPGPLPQGGCSSAFLDAKTARWRGDAGASWARADYASTLYNHALRPGGSPSCLAADGGSAFMGASSGHTRGVNLLMLDASVRLVLPTIDRRLWTEFARLPAPEPAPVRGIPLR